MSHALMNRFNRKAKLLSRLSAEKFTSPFDLSSLRNRDLSDSGRQ